LITRLKAEFPVTYLCAQMGVSVSGYYEYHAVVPGPRAVRHADLTVLVIAEFAASGRAAGYRKVAQSIRRGGEGVNRKTVAAIMAELGLISPAATRQHKIARERKTRTKDPADLLQRDFTSTTIGQVMVGDITYVKTGQGWLYVATVIDLASRAVLGYATGPRQTAQLVIRALKMAVSTGLLPEKAIFHTDHGVQYRSKAFARYCGQVGILRSMGRTFTCWDNACAETFFSKLKSERLTWIDFATRRAATLETIDYIQHYNANRLHQTLGYITPNERLHQLALAA
jgi:putative transposase